MSFLPAPGLAPGERAPTIVEGGGWAFGRLRCVDEPGCPPDPFLPAGYNVVRWDARGPGDSGGQAELDAPAYEGFTVAWRR